MRIERQGDTATVTEILGEIRRFESKEASIDEAFERWSFAVTAVLLALKLGVTVTHAMSPFANGLQAILMLGAAIVGTAVLGQVPTLARLVRQAISPSRRDSTAASERAADLELLERLQTYPPDELEKTRFLIASQGSNTARRLEFLVGPISRLGIVPAIVMLLTSFGRLGGAVSDGPVTLDAVHYATVLTFVLYFAAAIADSLNRRVAFYSEVLARAANETVHK